MSQDLVKIILKFMKYFEHQLKTKKYNKTNAETKTHMFSDLSNEESKKKNL